MPWIPAQRAARKQLFTSFCIFCIRSSLKNKGIIPLCIKRCTFNPKLQKNPQVPSSNNQQSSTPHFVQVKTNKNPQASGATRNIREQTEPENNENLAPHELSRYTSRIPDDNKQQQNKDQNKIIYADENTIKTYTAETSQLIMIITTLSCIIGLLLLIVAFLLYKTRSSSRTKKFTTLRNP